MSNYMSNGNPMIIYLIVGLIKKIYKMSYFPSNSKIKVQLDLSNDAIKSDLKKTQQVLIHQNLLKRLIYLFQNQMFIIQILIG